MNFFCAPKVKIVKLFDGEKKSEEFQLKNGEDWWELRSDIDNSDMLHPKVGSTPTWKFWVSVGDMWETSM